MAEIRIYRFIFAKFERIIYYMQYPMKKFLTRLFFILIAIVALTIYWKYYFTYSEGYRAGLLQKFSNKGSIFKTYEGELILSSVATTANMSIASEKFFFSVSDETVARKIEKMQGENVVVHYSEMNGTLPWRGETKYLVDSIMPGHFYKSN
jgi:lysophospholipid acyltransferase (LPLAT)-like uncharacterized protein